MSREDRGKWDARYRAGDHTAGKPSPFLVSLAARLPTGRALDVAGGAGRNALWLAAQGLDVTVADVSEVGLSLARERAAAAGLAIATRTVDLTAEPFPAGPWDLLLCILYLERSLFPAFEHALAPGGLFLWLHPTVENLERHPKPPRPFLLDRGEAPSLLGDLEVLIYDEGWSEDGFHEARVLARKRAR
jgi:hypothetical protein